MSTEDERTATEVFRDCLEERDIPAYPGSERYADTVTWWPAVNQDEDTAEQLGIDNTRGRIHLSLLNVEPEVAAFMASASRGDFNGPQGASIVEADARYEYREGSAAGVDVELTPIDEEEPDSTVKSDSRISFTFYGLEHGEPGPAGPDGSPGPKGDSITQVEVTLDGTYRENPTCVATIEDLEGTDKKLVLEFSGLRGVKGDTGETGLQGETGPAGPQGPPGDLSEDSEYVVSVAQGGTGATGGPEALDNLGAAPLVHNHNLSQVYFLEDWNSENPDTSGSLPDDSAAFERASHLAGDGYFAPDAHTHTASNVTDFDTAAVTAATDSGSFAPSMHTHEHTDITGGVTVLAGSATGASIGFDAGSGRASARADHDGDATVLNFQDSGPYGSYYSQSDGLWTTKWDLRPSTAELTLAGTNNNSNHAHLFRFGKLRVLILDLNSLTGSLAKASGGTSWKLVTLSEGDRPVYASSSHLACMAEGFDGQIEVVAFSSGDVTMYNRTANSLSANSLWRGTIVWFTA